MNSRFTVILILITAALLAWTYIHHQYQESRQFRLQQLSGLPVYVYMDNAIAMDSLAIELHVNVAEIDSLAKESGREAAEALLREYELGIEPNTLRDYRFPNVMTLFFKASGASFAAREQVLELLRERGVPEADIDSQAAAWGLVKTEIDHLTRRWSNSTLFTALVFFLMFLFARLYLFLAQALTPRDMRATILESIRKSELKKWQSIKLLMIPFLVNVLGYLALAALGLLKPLVDWTFFLVQFISVLAASVIAILLDNTREPGVSGSGPSITVTVPGKSDALDS
ncbi:MAG: hypothetical protein K0B87_00920 [Candidatus Syntrophosphaera sp.]|nr:hypothetical protein [Candidatus Syntrophosphaera sp.]